MPILSTAPPRTRCATAAEAPEPTAVSHPAVDRTDGAACRCTCGSLLARLSDAGVELKCRRCKRNVLLPWPRAGRWEPLRRASDPTTTERPEVAHPEPGTIHRGEF